MLNLLSPEVEAARFKYWGWLASIGLGYRELLVGDSLITGKTGMVSSSHNRKIMEHCISLDTRESEKYGWAMADPWPDLLFVFPEEFGME